MSSPPVDLTALQNELLAGRRALEAELGLSEPPQQPLAAPAARRRVPRAPAAAAALVAEATGWRRSPRVVPSAGAAAASAPASAASAAAVGGKRARGDASGPSSYNLPPPPAPGALKSFSCDIARMNGAWLGRAVPATEGNFFKKAVAAAAVSGGASFAWTHLGGIKEFRNAVLLFIQIGGGSENTLRDGGRLVTWAAQNKQTLFSAQLLRILHHAEGCWYPPPPAQGGATGAPDGGAAGDDGDDGEEPERTFLPPCTVALAARLQDGEPYTWCGELDYVSHDPRSHPVEVVWRIRHYDELLAAVDGDGAPGERFRALLAAGGVAAR